MNKRFKAVDPYSLCWQVWSWDDYDNTTLIIDTGYPPAYVIKAYSDPHQEMTYTVPSNWGWAW